MHAKIPGYRQLVCGSLLAIAASGPSPVLAAPMSDARFAPALREASSAARRALELATSDARVVAIVPDADRRVVAVDRIEVKLETERGSRVEQVRAVVAGRRSAAAFTVDADTGRVVAVEPFDPMRVPFDEVDLQRATTLALEDREVREFLGRNASRYSPQFRSSEPERPFAVQMLPVRGIRPEDPCTRARCVDLLFRGERGYLVGRRVTVDLTNERVESSQGSLRRHD